MKVWMIVGLATVGLVLVAVSTYLLLTPSKLIVVPPQKIAVVVPEVDVVPGVPEVIFIGITTVAPSDLEEEYGLSKNIVITFDEEMNPNTINQDTVLIEGTDGLIIDRVVTSDSTGKIWTINPKSELKSYSLYNITVTTGARGISGNTLIEDFLTSFTTGQTISRPGGVESSSGAPDIPFSSVCSSGCNFSTIQAAIDFATSGDLIKVSAGNYTEQLNITKNLTLQGSSAIIKAPPILAAGLNGYKSIVTISNSTIEFSGFTVSGPGSSQCNDIHVGIFVRDGANANIHDNNIIDIRNQPFSSCQSGNGILVGRNVFSTIGTATITNNQIINYQKTGIVVDNLGSSAIISGNNITGVGVTPSIAQNGIQISRGALATIDSNFVSGNKCSAASCGPNILTQTQSVGILFFQAGNDISVTNNVISDNDIGFYNHLNSSGKTLVTGNTLSSNRYTGIALIQGNATIDNNNIIGGNQGLVAVSFAGNTEHTEGVLNGNTLSGALIVGIQLLDDSLVDSFVAKITAHRNKISGNGFGLNNTLTNVVNASANWWGDATGPFNALNNPDGLGDAVSNNVNFSNFCTNSVCD